MSLLELDGVGRSERGAAQRCLLGNVSLDLDARELVAVWSPHERARSALLRIAAGIEPPDGGTVRFGGRPLHERRGDLLGRRIGYCRAPLRSLETGTVIDELIVGQLAHGVPGRQARRRALAALERSGAAGCAAREPAELDGTESQRAALARALVLSPSLLVVENPTGGVDLLARDSILALLRSLADEDGMAVLIGTGDATALAGADRALSLTDGVLRGSAFPELAPVVELRRRASA